jgi:hypothetical protein
MLATIEKRGSRAARHAKALVPDSGRVANEADLRRWLKKHDARLEVSLGRLFIKDPGRLLGYPELQHNAPIDSLKTGEVDPSTGVMMFGSSILWTSMGGAGLMDVLLGSPDIRQQLAVSVAIVGSGIATWKHSYDFLCGHIQAHTAGALLDETGGSNQDRGYRRSHLAKDLTALHAEPRLNVDAFIEMAKFLKTEVGAQKAEKVFSALAMPVPEGSLGTL